MKISKDIFFYIYFYDFFILLNIHLFIYPFFMLSYKVFHLFALQEYLYKVQKSLWKFIGQKVQGTLNRKCVIWDFKLNLIC